MAILGFITAYARRARGLGRGGGGRAARHDGRLALLELLFEPLDPLLALVAAVNPCAEIKILRGRVRRDPARWRGDAGSSPLGRPRHRREMIFEEIVRTRRTG